MDATVMRVTTSLTLLALCLLNSSAHAELDLHEYRLLKSWGMQADTRGRLIFNPEREHTPAEEPLWQPDLTPYRVRPAMQAAESLNPVVISTK